MVWNETLYYRGHWSLYLSFTLLIFYIVDPSFLNIFMEQGGVNNWKPNSLPE
jgi:hypothetical protein